MGNNVLTTLQYQLGKKLSEGSRKMNAISQTYYVCLINVIPLCILFYFFESNQAMLYPRKTENGFLFGLFMSSILGFLISLGINMNNIVNSPISVTITGSTKNIIGTLIGIFAFNDVIVTLNLMVGLILCTLGSIMYAYTKYKQMTDITVTKVVNV